MSPSAAVLLLRLTAVLVAVPVPWLAWRGAMAVGASPAAAAAAAFVPVGWPHLAHVTASVSHAALLLVTTTAALVGLLTVLRGDRRWWVAASTGLLVSAALLTKGLALGLGVAVAVTLGVAASRFGRAAARPALLVVLGCLPGLAWYVANVVRFGQVQPSGWPPGFFDPSQQPPVGLRFIATYLDGVSATLWFNPLEFEVPLPTPVHRLLTLAVVLVVLVGLLLARDRWGYLVLASAPVTAFALTLYGTVVQTEATGTVFAGARGRYLQVMVAVLVAAAALVADRGPPRARAVLPGVALVVVAVSVATVVQHFWTGEGVLASVATAGAWWPAGTALLGAGAVAVVAGIVGGAVLLGAPRRSSLMR
jgi:hypothetical protein